MISTRLAAMLLAFCITFALLATVTLSAIPETQFPSTEFCPNFNRESTGTARLGISSEQPAPTLAPLREDFYIHQARRPIISLKGKPVFLRVEADSDELEISWASP
jgi:hypothetical protein